MSDISPETEYAEYAEEAPGSSNYTAGSASPSASSPEDGDRADQEAHGGSMAPGLVDDAGNQIEEPPPAP
ncbi:hypothetical protein [Paractinoplanes atraurantiacus]|uniref:Uncharacterized protein n=1 Tax=Paractinoplanes atraurantiacus TaxID=1036182 RepID=A0A285J0Q9_9ACTN|nr:hypothetical protein [Actinoplanes atraurantiacus]SNY53778.1 hypothetical protein SAMN05421748_114169 [Actinoplanes atraurantiacus]